MAEVFAGHAVGDHGFQKPVAIKRLLPELANDEVFVERLIEEAKLVVGMQHGNIVSVLDLAREGDDVFLVMEFVDGPSLRQLIKARGARGLPLGVTTYIVQSAAAGLEFAHARPGGAIIHADISPSNLLLTTSGEVRVADFGIARREGLGQGVVEGKWAYMAPEQARGEPLTPRSDVFALGVVLYELLTGQHPFGRAVTANERDAQLRVLPPRVIRPSIPPALDAICMRALAYEPCDRYARMQQLIDALVEQRFANGYREGASDLAQAIRDVVPRADLGAPRTQHTERPLTIVTRSLLREVTPLQRSRASLGYMAAPVSPEPPAEVMGSAPFELSPTTVFPPLRSSAAFSHPTTGEFSPPPPVEHFAMMPTFAAPTTERSMTPLSDAFGASTAEIPTIPPSGAHAVERSIDPRARTQAAEDVVGLLAHPPALHAEGTPIPAFRASRIDVNGDELASVVGGNTLTGRAPGVAVAPRTRRWTLVMLGAAALFGVCAAIMIQLEPTRPGEVAVAELVAQIPGSVTEREPAAPTAEPARPTPTAATAGPSPEPDVRDTPPARDPDAPAAALPPSGEPLATVIDTAGIDRAPITTVDDEPLVVGSAGDAGTPDARSAPRGRATLDDRTADAAIAAPRSSEGRSSSGTVRPRPARSKSEGDGDRDGDRDDGLSGGELRPRDSRPDARGGHKVVATKDGGKRKMPQGVLRVQSLPWSWVTVDVETKETPATFYLAPGKYTVKFHNQDNGVIRYDTVIVESGGTKKLNMNMEK